MRRVPWATLGALLLLAGAVRAGEDAPVLRFDPFARPDLSALSGKGERGRPSAEWTPVLRSTLVAGEGSLANLGGVVLRIGEEAHGYRLVEVKRYSAVFEREGVRVELGLLPAAEDAP